MNAVLTVLDPTASPGSAAAGTQTVNGGYRTISATGLNSDQVSGLGGMSGVVITLANPGNVGEKYGRSFEKPLVPLVQ